jgi:hypothetical protein
VNIEDFLTHKTCFVGPENVFIEYISSELLTQLLELHL